MSKFEKISRRCRQDFCPVCVDSNFVFQPYSTDSFYINPGFERNHTTCPDFRLLITANPGTLMDFDPKPVARTMHEISPEATMSEQTPGRPVHASGAYTGAESLMRSLLGLLNCFIPTSNPRGCAPQKNRARNVTAVVAEYSTQVQHHQFVFPQAFFGRLRMGQRRTRTGGHDSVKRRCARAFAPQSVVDLRSNIHFRNSGADEIRRFRHDFGSNPRRLAHHIEFLSAFYFSNALDKARRRLPSDARTGGFLQSSPFADVQGCSLKRHTQALSGRPRAEKFTALLRQGDSGYVHTCVRSLVMSLDRISAVGEEMHGIIEEKKYCIATAEPADVKDVG